MRKATSLFFLMLWFIIPCLAQQKLIDSLEFVIESKSTTNEGKLISMIELGKYYINEEKTEALDYCKNIVSLARQQDNDNLKLLAYTSLAYIASKKDSVELSYHMIDTCFQYIKKVEDTNAKAESLLAIAKIKSRFKDNSDVLSLTLDALDIAKASNNTKLLSKIYFFLSFDYYFQSSDIINQEKYTDLYYQMAVKLNDKNMLEESFRTKAFLMRRKYIQNRNNENYIDSSIYFLNKSIDIYNLNKDYIPANNYMLSLGHLISGYTYKTFERNDSTFYTYPDSIFRYSNIMLKQAKEMNNLKYQITAYRFLSGWESNQKNFRKATDMLLEAMDLVKDEKYFLSEKYFLCIDLAYQLKITGDYEEALNYLENAFVYQRERYQEEYALNGRVAEARFKVKESEQKVLIEQERQKQERKTFLWIGVSLVTLLILIIILYNNRLHISKQKQILLKKEKEEAFLHIKLKEKEAENAEAQKRTVELEIELEKEKAERQALQINRLQKELIVGTTQLEHKNEMLETIRQKLDIENLSANKNEIIRLLADGRKADNQFDDFTDSLRNIHPDFYLKLQEKASQKLTALDLKYCTYIFMNLSSKDIANILYVDPKTVRITKYRLKQKLGLSKDDNLNFFIQNII